MTVQDDIKANVKVPTEISNEENSITPCIFSRMWVFLLIFLIGIAGTTFALKIKPELFNMESGQQTGLLGFNSSHDQTNEKIRKLSNRISLLEVKVSTFETAETVTTVIADEASTDNFSKLKEGVKTLFETSENIGLRFEAALTKALHGQKNRQANVSFVMGYMQLKDKALDGVSFSEALINMQKMTGLNAEIKTTLDKLKVYAEKGVSTRIELYQEWLKIVPTATNLIRQDQATTWKERITVALDSLVSVKSLKEDSTDNVVIKSLSVITADLEQGSIKTALTKVNGFSERIKQNVMMSWAKKARDYVNVETLLADISNAIMFPSIQKEQSPAAVLKQQKIEPKKEGK